MPKPIKLKPEIEDEFKSLMSQSPNGLLMPGDVVESAKDTDSPLHNYFTWDDSEAAKKWRIEEAKTLIRSYSVYNEELNINIRALTSLDIDRSDTGGYRWTMEIVERPDLRQQLIDTALKELNAVRDKYSHIQELASVWEVIDSQDKQA